MKFFSVSFIILSLMTQVAVAKTCSLVESTINPNGTYTKLKSVPFEQTANPNVFKAETTEYSATVWLQPRGASCEINGPFGRVSKGGAVLPEDSEVQPSISLIKGTKLDIYDISISAQINCEK